MPDEETPFINPQPATIGTELTPDHLRALKRHIDDMAKAAPYPQHLLCPICNGLATPQHLASIHPELFEDGD